MLEIGTSGSMSGERKRGVAAWPKLPRLSSTLPHWRKAPPAKFRETARHRRRRLRPLDCVREGERLTRYAATQNETIAEQAGGFSITLICHASCIKYNWGRRTDNTLG